MASPSGDDPPEPGAVRVNDSASTNGLDLQVAADRLTSGHTDGFNAYLRRVQHVDLDSAGVRFQRLTSREVPRPGGGAERKYTYVVAFDGPRPAAGPAPAPRSPPAPRGHPAPPREPYAYDALRRDAREIRLLRLGGRGDARGGADRLRLRTFRLAEAPAYLCLSYVWGRPERPVWINVDGRVLHVTANLYHGLATCFGRYGGAWLWADGICINQGDLGERGWQVQLMGEIYKRAQMVVALPGHYNFPIPRPRGDGAADVPPEPEYLALVRREFEEYGSTVFGPRRSANRPPVVPPGPAPTDSPGIRAQKALSLMTYMYRIWSTTSAETQLLSDLDWARWDMPPDDDVKTWVGLMSFWADGWFFRAWILQEVVLARSMVFLYRDAEISLDAVVRFWAGAEGHNLPRQLRLGPLADVCAKVGRLSFVRAAQRLRDGRRLDAPSSAPDPDPDRPGAGAGDDGPGPDAATPSLLEVLALSRSNLATDPRDKVYSVLGLTDDPVARALVPDYAPANDAGRVYLDVAVRLVGAGHGAELLHHAGADRRTSGLPSWVPDWTYQSRSALRTHLYGGGMAERPDAVGLVPPDGGHGPAPRLLRVRGVVLASVLFAGPGWRYYSHDGSQPPFAPSKHNPAFHRAPFNDEDARDLLLGVALRLGDQGCPPRYASEGWESAAARTLAADVSWRGQRIGPDPAGRVTTEDGRDRWGGGGAPIVGPAGEFFGALRAFRAFYARRPRSMQELQDPGAGVRVHGTGIYRWLLDCDEEEEADLQRRMVPFTVALQNVQKGRCFAILDVTTAAATGKERATREKAPVGKWKFDDDDDPLLGTLPWDAQEGDVVALLEGFRTPFVLRSVESDEKHGEGKRYELVGDCYVHGVMDGELLCRGDCIPQEALEGVHMGLDARGERYAVQRDGVLLSFMDLTLS